MPKDRLLNNYFNSPRSTLRRLADKVEVGESLTISEIADRTEMSRSLVHNVLRKLEVRENMKREPFVWPPPPEESGLWGRRRWIQWRFEVGGAKTGTPADKWRFLGFMVTPVDELLSLARLDLRVEACPS